MRTQKIITHPSLLTKLIRLSEKLAIKYEIQISRYTSMNISQLINYTTQLVTKVILNYKLNRLFISTNSKSKKKERKISIEFS